MRVSLRNAVPWINVGLFLLFLWQLFAFLSIQRRRVDSSDTLPHTPKAAIGKSTPPQPFSTAKQAKALVLPPRYSNRPPAVPVPVTFAAGVLGGSTTIVCFPPQFGDLLNLTDAEELNLRKLLPSFQLSYDLLLTRHVAEKSVVDNTLKGTIRIPRADYESYLSDVRSQLEMILDRRRSGLASAIMFPKFSAGVQFQEYTISLQRSASEQASLETSPVNGEHKEFRPITSANSPFMQLFITQ